MRIRQLWWWRLLLAQLTSPLWRIKAWRYLQYWRHRQDGCTCALADIDYFGGQVGHPHKDCPLRDTCASPYSHDRCGGCDWCIEDQIIYERTGKTVEERRND